MKYLVIGDASSMHIFNFVKSFLLPSGYEVHLLTLSTLPVKEDFRAFYREQGVAVHAIAEKNYKRLERTDKLSRLLNLWRKFRLMKEVPHVDVCHLQSVYKTSVAMVLKNKRKFDHLILSYWGGDVEDRAPSTLKLREKCFPLADVITVTVQQTVHDFHEVHGHTYDDKLMVSRFSTKGLDCIHQLQKTTTRKECREAYGIPEGKIAVTCGYSAYAEQHQEQCLQEMMKLPRELRERLFVIVPMQYGRFNQAYIDRVHAQKEKCDFDCVILEEYVPFEMSAKLAIATDIYLHLRDTDAFSNALKEHVYSGSTVITGTWLKYIELEEMQAPMISIDSIDHLSETLLTLLPNTEIAEEISLFAPMYDLYSTENIVEQWNKVIAFAIK